VNRRSLCVCLVVLALATASSGADEGREALLRVSEGQVPSDTGSDGLTKFELEQHPELGGQALKVVYHAGDSFGDRVAKVTDWKPFVALEFEAFNPAKENVSLTLTVKHRRTTGYQTRIDAPIVLEPGKNAVRIGIDELRNVNGSEPDLTAVQRWYIACAAGAKPTLYFGDIWLVGKQVPKPSAEPAEPARRYRVTGKIGDMAVDLTVEPMNGAAPKGAAAPLHGDPARLARIRAAKMPPITKPVLFHTPEADAILAALEVFPPDNPWNLVVEEWPLHPNSKRMIASVGDDKPFRCNTDMGFVLVPPGQKRVDVTIVGYPGESDKGPYPVPDTVPIEGWPVYYKGQALTLEDVQRDKLGKGGDRHALVVDPVNRMLYEFYAMKRTDAGALRVLCHEAHRRRLAGDAGLDLRPQDQQAAAQGLDLLRRGRPARLPRRRPLRRARARHGRARHARDHPQDPPRLRRPRHPLRQPPREPRLPAHGRAHPPPPRLRHRRLLAAGAGHPQGPQEVWDAGRRQRHRVGHLGRARPKDPRHPRRAAQGPRPRLRGRPPAALRRSGSDALARTPGPGIPAPRSRSALVPATATSTIEAGALRPSREARSYRGCWMKPLLVMLMCTLPALSSEYVAEPPSELPVAFQVDVVVAGGSLAGVEAACAAAEKGAEVLLVESRPYLGCDLCGAQRLWLDEDETPGTRLTKQLFGDAKIVTPFAVKRALDQALIDAGVQFLTGTFVGELLVRRDGSPGGITIVNRSGRQAALAKVVIDATKDAAIARQSDAKLEASGAGPRDLRMIVVGGELVEGKGVKGRRLPVLYRSPPRRPRKRKGTRGQQDYPVHQYTLRLEMPSDSFRAQAAALNEARAMVQSPGIVDQAEYLTCVPENTIVPVASGSDKLGAFRPAGVPCLYILSAYAGLPRREMQKLIRPVSLAAIGRRIGIAAAETARGVSAPKDVGFKDTARGGQRLAVAAAPASVRFQHCPKLQLAARDLPVLGEYDVVVVGGGTAGAPAGIAAARAGAKTLVIEYMDELGGVGTAGLIGSYWYGNRIGFTAEAQKALGARWDAVAKSEWYRAELAKGGAEIWHGSFGCGALLDGTKVSGVVVATPLGRGVVLADVVIDGTGNADVAAAAGAATEFSITPLGGLSVQVAGYPHRNLGDSGNNTCYALVDDRDVFDRWHLLVSAKRELRKTAYDMGQLIDTRERRRIVGDHKLTTIDILTRRTFPDTVCHFYSNFDAAAFPSAKLFLVKDMKGPCFHCDMPLRCLTPKGLEGLLAVGLGASAERDAMTLTRMQADVQNQGYAAGLAAALAAKETGGLIRKLDVKQLQQRLVEHGCLKPRVLTDGDSFPIGSAQLEAAVETLHALTIQPHQNPRHDETFPALAAVMGHPKEAIPLLKEAYRKARDEEDRIHFARVLAVLGDATGKATLLRAVEAAASWGRGCALTGHRKELNIFGEVDRLVIALGFTRAPEVIPALVRKLEALDADSDLSHYKAICLASRLNKDRSLARPLARLLDKKGVSGHVQPLSYYAASNGALSVPRRARVGGSNGKNLLNSKLKELLVAALLFECGDHDGRGRRALEAYRHDVNGHFAAYAHFVLSRSGSANAR